MEWFGKTVELLVHAGFNPSVALILVIVVAVTLLSARWSWRRVAKQRLELKLKAGCCHLKFVRKPPTPPQSE
jgi:hypothetical protein